MNALLHETRTLSDQAFKKLQETALRIRTSNTAYDLWEQVFLPEDRTRLGGSLEAAYARGGAVRMWANLHGCTDVRAVIEIAFAFNFLTTNHRRWLLNESGELLDADAAFEDAIVHNELVLNSLTREIYWLGGLIDLDWSHEAKWSFMWELARHAKAGLSIDCTMFGRTKKRDYVSKLKSELTNLEGFPLDLADLIRPVCIGTQQLEVSAEQIRLFEHNVGGEIREWMP